MSQLRQRATRVMQQGEIERRDWSPSADSAHYKVYLWWVRRSGRWVPRENFCHYWRVVFIWAPLRWLAMPLLWLLGIAAGATAVWVAATFTSTVLGIVALLAGIGYLWVGFKTTGQLLCEIDDEFDEFAWSWLNRRGKAVKGLMTLVFLPICVAAAAVILVGGALYAIVSGLHEDHNVFNRSREWFFGARFSNNKWLAWIRPWLVLPVTLVVLSLFSEVARGILAICLIISGIAGVFLLCAFLADRQEQREQLKKRNAKREQYDLILRWVFRILHPKKHWVEYAQWRERYDAYCQEKYFTDVYDIDLEWHLRYVSERFNRLLLQVSVPKRTARALRTVPSVQRAPNRSRWSNFRRAARDFLALLWSVVLTKKWKVCPKVVLPH